VNIPLDEDGEPMRRGDDEERFQYGRAGDHLITMFQCDLCHFRNMLGRNPTPSDLENRVFGKCLRRAILDALWSRERSTVSSNFRRVVALERLGSVLGFPGIVPELGPFPVEDSVGMKLAMAMVLKSLDPGINAATVQFDTVRQFRSAFSNAYGASPLQRQVSLFASAHKKMHGTSSPSDSEWFSRFSLGMEKRLGRQLHQDLGISIGVMLEVQRDLESRWWECRTAQARRPVAELAVLFIVVYCWGLRGEEVFLISLGALRKVWGPSQSHVIPHVLLALVGRRKRLIGCRAFLLPCVLETASGLRPGLWLGRIIEAFEGLGLITGYVMVRDDGGDPRLSDYNQVFVECLMGVQARRPDLIHPDIDVAADFGLPRSGRRGATTQARVGGVSEMDIGTNQLWRKTELNVGRTFRFGDMIPYYTEVAQSLPLQLRFSKAL